MVGAAFDAFSTAQGGWDYTNLMALGATAAIARLLNLNADQTREAMGMTAIPHFAADEIESGELNRRGDLSMWKRLTGPTPSGIRSRPVSSRRSASKRR